MSSHHLGVLRASADPEGCANVARGGQAAVKNCLRLNGSSWTAPAALRRRLNPIVAHPPGHDPATLAPRRGRRRGGRPGPGHCAAVQLPPALVTPMLIGSQAKMVSGQPTLSLRFHLHRRPQ